MTGNLGIISELQMTANTLRPLVEAYRKGQKFASHLKCDALADIEKYYADMTKLIETLKIPNKDSLR